MPSPTTSSDNPQEPEVAEGRSRYDVDRDGAITDLDLAAVEPPSRWSRFGLRGPAIILRWSTRNAKRLLVLIVGLTVLAAGVAMLVLPGPGLIVMFVGLAILATEFAWAEAMLDRTKGVAAKTASSLSSSRQGRYTLGGGGIAMIAAGFVAGFVFDKWVMGIATIVGGAIALASLHPAVVRRFALEAD